MTEIDRTAITLIVDRSGSMGQIREEAQGALDEFVKAQREVPGDVLWTIVYFNKDYDRPFFNAALPAEFSAVLVPSGMTALNDAVGRTIVDLGLAFAEMDEDERPAKVIVAILTDGQENSSTEYTTEQVRGMVKHQTDEWNWEFVFLATGMSQFVAEGAAMRIGVAAGQTIAVDYADHFAGTQHVNSYVAQSRAAGPGERHMTLAEVKAKREKERRKSD